MAARDERVVRTVPGAASDPPENPVPILVKIHAVLACRFRVRMAKGREGTTK